MGSFFSKCIHDKLKKYGCYISYTKYYDKYYRSTHTNLNCAICNEVLFTLDFCFEDDRSNYNYATALLIKSKLHYQKHTSKKVIAG